MSFADLGLTEPLLRKLAACQYAEPTPIQQQAIPAILQGRDVLGLAPTGSGKTAAYCLPLLQQLSALPESKVRRLQVLVLVPTRELAIQVDETLGQLSQGTRLKRVLAYGGVSINPQMMDLRGGADVVIATPGRLLDLLGQNALSLGSLSTLVLDEADRLLDMDFADELGRLLALMPTQRQNLFFSATFPAAVMALADRLLRNPVRIVLTTEPADAPAISQRAIQVDDNRRTALLRHLLQQAQWTQVLVFAASQHAAERLADKLGSAGIAAAALHGQLSQGRRGQVLQDFKAGLLQVLVATDIAARGIDIVQLPVVVNYDLPRSAVDYAHRIGRTGRAGADGLAVSFISADTEAHFRLIEKRQGLRVGREVVAGYEPIQQAWAVVDASGNGGIKGKRKSKKDKLREAAAYATKEKPGA
ncbi:DEAD/DEAH box helicase [Chitinimonas viridis]|uniref:DEAD/DEAH box helicase n=1 Tax=Chitinimonas viridis TaxID=664880 RepID=A0ABT8B6Y2_9NEIS|nr:DEAD/DEAH box helicase [Chitinimonas viridis]MDN3577351.1 DEAD/DEAH box helicase [Chitinimonas viridis]